MHCVWPAWAKPTRSFVFFSDDVSIGLSVKFDQVCVLSCVTCHIMHTERITSHRWGR